MATNDKKLWKYLEEPDEALITSDKEVVRIEYKSPDGKDVVSRARILVIDVDWKILASVLVVNGIKVEENEPVAITLTTRKAIVIGTDNLRMEKDDETVKGAEIEGDLIPLIKDLDMLVDKTNEVTDKMEEIIKLK